VDLGSSGLSTIVALPVTSRVKHAVAANLDTLEQLLGAGAFLGPFPGPATLELEADMPDGQQAPRSTA
jgi:hypothetical protein